MTAVHTKMRRNKFESATAGALVLPISLPVFNLQEPLVLYRGLHLRPRRAGQDRALARGRERRSIAACAAVVKDVGRWWVPDGGLFYTCKIRGREPGGVTSCGLGPWLGSSTTPSKGGEGGTAISTHLQESCEGWLSLSYAFEAGAGGLVMGVIVSWMELAGWK